MPRPEQERAIVSDDCRDFPVHKAMEPLEWREHFAEVADVVREIRKGRRGVAEMTKEVVLAALDEVPQQYRAKIDPSFLSCFQMGFEARWDDEDWTHAQRWDRRCPWSSERQDSTCKMFMFVNWRFGWHVADRVRAPEALRTPTGRLKKDCEQRF